MGDKRGPAWLRRRSASIYHISYVRARRFYAFWFLVAVSAFSSSLDLYFFFFGGGVAPRASAFGRAGGGVGRPFGWAGVRVRGSVMGRGGGGREWGPVTYLYSSCVGVIPNIFAALSLDGFFFAACGRAALGRLVRWGARPWGEGRFF